MSDTRSVGNYRGSFVIKFRQRHGLTREALAEILGLTEAAIVMWETDKRGLSEPIYRLLQMFDNKPELMKEF